MEERLGTALIRAGRIDSAALEEALDVQITTGGRLGSVLVALGHLREEDLATFLSEHHGLPVVDRESLSRADPHLFGDFSRDFAAHHQVICLAVLGRNVEVAMVDPGDVTAREVVEQRTRRRLILKVVPEAMFWDYAQRHYDLKKPERLSWTHPDASGRAGTPPGASPDERAELFGARNAHIGGDFTMRAPEAPAPSAPRTPVVPWARLPLDQRTEDELLATMINATERSELGNALEVWARRHAHGFAALVLRRNEAEGWVALSGGERMARVEALSFSLENESVFRDVVQMEAGYQGSAPGGAIEQTFFAALGRARPRELLLLPVIVQGRVVNLLYLDGGPEAPLAYEAREELERVAEIISATYLRMILTQRAKMRRDRMSEASDPGVGG
ncbi:MAG: hypothetical protein P1V51_04190 [Deltaproteobacteria bacterium]|nr:hypothetical protein [Deltaproteobacteria bacterium]